MTIRQASTTAAEAAATAERGLQVAKDKHCRRCYLVSNVIIYNFTFLSRTLHTYLWRQLNCKQDRLCTVRRRATPRRAVNANDCDVLLLAVPLLPS